MKTAVVIPSYQASRTLPTLLERTLRFLPATAVIVVDDGSWDETGTIARQYGVVVQSHDRNRGKGAALRTGFAEAKRMHAGIILTMDADLQHQPEEIPNFITFHEVTQCEVVIGNRMHHADGMPFHRFLSNSITSALVRMRTGKDIPDSQSGFRLITRRVLDTITVENDGFEAETEILIKAAAMGATFGAIPIDTIYAGEKSHMTHLQTTLNFLKVLLKQF